ncbi:MAG: ferritin-like domain-containing protein [Firmicutes bacterium]|nr:ferritin-like domain-containing protein [Bacillota bacterium]
MEKIKYGLRDDWILEEMMKVAIEDEKCDMEKYRRLARNAKKEHDQKLLFSIADEERRHRKALQFLFHSFFGKDVETAHCKGDHYGDFMEAIRKSIVSEYGAVAFYREILNRIPDDRMRTPIRQIMADEQKHAQILEGIMEYK